MYRVDSGPLVDRSGFGARSVKCRSKLARQAKFVRRCTATLRPHRSKRRRAQHPALYIKRDPHTRSPQPQEDARDRLLSRSPGAPLFLFSLFFSVRLSLADAAALRPMRAPPCRAASWPRSGRRPRRRSWPTSPTRRSTWSARGAAAAPRPPPPPRGLRPETPSRRSSTTVRALQVPSLQAGLAGRAASACQGPARSRLVPRSRAARHASTARDAAGQQLYFQSQ